MNDSIRKGAQLLRDSDKILVFAGAGLSTESGIPDFRSPGGVWDRYDPSDFYFDKIIASEEIRERYWQMSTEFYGVMKDASPNSGHLAIKTIEDKGKLLAVVTQNIDHLHHKAGNSPDKIIEIHGTAFSVSCLSCAHRYDRNQIQDRIAAGVKVPYCDQCGGILKPETISFGQAMPEEKMRRAMSHAQDCDFCVVLGSSLVVYPAASIPVLAVQSGASLMIINRDETPLDSEARVVIHDSVSKTLEEMLKLAFFS